MMEKLPLLFQRRFLLFSNISAKNKFLAFDVIKEKQKVFFVMKCDGSKIVLIRMGAKTELFGIVIYDVASNKQEELTDFGELPVWLNDNRRVIFFDRNIIYLLDTFTKKQRN